MSAKRATIVQQHHFLARLVKDGRPYQIAANNQTDVSLDGPDVHPVG